MGKTNTERQKDYRERKKLNDPNYFKKESQQQSRFYEISKPKLKERRETIKDTVWQSQNWAKEVSSSSGAIFDKIPQMLWMPS